jgi:flagellar protein FlgJ
MDINAVCSYLKNTRQAPFSQGGAILIVPGFGQGGGVPLLGAPKETDITFAGILEKFRDTHPSALERTEPATPSGDNPQGTAGGIQERARNAAEPASRQEPPPALSNRKPVIDKTDKLYEQCESLETFLVKTLITGMRNTVQKSKLIDTGLAGQMYEDMLYDEYARDFTRNAGFGLAELAYLELTGQRGKALANHP